MVLLQPRQVRAFALYKLRRAKNDRLDAASSPSAPPISATRAKRRTSGWPPLAEHLLFIEQFEADRPPQDRREHFTDKRILKQIERDVEALKRPMKPSWLACKPPCASTTISPGGSS